MDIILWKVPGSFAKLIFGSLYYLLLIHYYIRITWSDFDQFWILKFDHLNIGRKILSNEHRVFLTWFVSSLTFQKVDKSKKKILLWTEVWVTGEKWEVKWNGTECWEKATRDRSERLLCWPSKGLYGSPSYPCDPTSFFLSLVVSDMRLSSSATWNISDLILIAPTFQEMDINTRWILEENWITLPWERYGKAFFQPCTRQNCNSKLCLK